MNPLNTEPQIIIFVSSITLLVVVVYLSLLYFQKIKKQILISERKLTDEIRFSIQPMSDIPLGVEEITELATEVWRIEQRIAKVGSKVDDIHKKGLDNSIQRLKRYLQKYDVEIHDYTGQKYNDGLNLDVLSREIDRTIQFPIVKETVEPTITCRGRVVKKAKIILASNQD